MCPKSASGQDVHQAAIARIAYIFDCFAAVYVSFSGGKDSTVMLHLVMAEAARRQRKVGVLFIDLEAQYKLTIEHVQACYELYSDLIEPYWIALPLHLQWDLPALAHWVCWEPGREDDWVRQPPAMAITDTGYFPWFRPGMEFEEFVEDFGGWYSQGGKRSTACLVGIRAGELLNRYRTLVADKTRFNGLGWTTWKGGSVFNAYPLYDWRTEDIWAYHGKFGKPYNRLYDRIVQELIRRNWTDQRIAKELGMDSDEVLRLKQITGLAELFADRDFSAAWEAD
ncbi:MAG TPA: phosphoadenosine phosphosulfate reductase family protein [Dehalococcoidia bacterium]|nr:phosphoadenosine phosphosulfate reductase family protein [Dehalococcoidia bacterium]